MLASMPCPPILTEVDRYAPGWTYRDAHTCTGIERYVHMDTRADRWKCIDTHARILTCTRKQFTYTQMCRHTYGYTHGHTDVHNYLFLY